MHFRRTSKSKLRQGIPEPLGRTSPLVFNFHYCQDLNMHIRKSLTWIWIRNIQTTIISISINNYFGKRYVVSNSTTSTFLNISQLQNIDVGDKFWWQILISLWPSEPVSNFQKLPFKSLWTHTRFTVILWEIISLNISFSNCWLNHDFGFYAKSYLNRILKILFYLLMVLTLTSPVHLKYIFCCSII